MTGAGGQRNGNAADPAVLLRAAQTNGANERRSLTDGTNERNC